MRQLIFFISFFFAFNLSAQRGKNGAVTISNPNQVLNAYTSLTADANAGATSITVANNALPITGFSFGNLQQGDLIMIIQMQGVPHAAPYADITNLNMNDYPEVSWGGGVEVNSNYGNSYPNAHKYGRIANYGNAGNFELREVQNITGSTTILLTCGLENNYISSGKVQIVRIPRLSSLTISPSGSITSPSWDGTIGGIVALEVDGNLINNSTNGIDVTGRGFRGGAASNTTTTGTNTAHTDGPGNGSTFLGTMNATLGGEIGESIIGFTTEYTLLHSRYGRGAIGNGGGGAGIQNAGGGGGSNIGDTIGHTGKGIPTPGYVSFWNTEKANMATTLSSGGGRGGYSYAITQSFGVTPYVGPNNTGWGGDARKENGGYGGHALVYRPTKLFLGGGGGSGSQDSGQGGAGGAGGGIVHLTVYGAISGTGGIVANGQKGQNSNPNNQPTAFTPTSARRKGNDGAGGGGGGGYIYIKNSNAIPSTTTLTAIGGEGGTHNLTFDTGFGGTHELCGPGAGGAGGGIAYASGSPVTSVIGGIPGVTRSQNAQNPMSANFPMNGATSGGNGLTNLPTTTYDIIAANDTICGAQSATLSVSVTGTLPSGSTIGWYTTPYGGSPVATGTTFNTPTLSSNTTYYVGTCPGTFRKPVNVVVGSNPVISGTPVIVDATCTAGGSISGLSASGGVGTLTYTWNGVASVGTGLSNASTGNYTLIVTDENGCFSQSGPHTINGVGGPSISGTPTIVAQTCVAQGSISGLTITSSVPIDSYEWNGITSPDQNLTANAGSYTLIVTDDNGCTAQSGPHVIGSSPMPVITGTALITNENCNDGGSISGLTASGGLAPYSYEWNGNNYSSADLLDTTSGSYTLTVTDDNGCQVQSGPHQIGLDSAPVISGTPTITNATCTAQGSITGLTVSGGLAPYDYSWNGTVTPSTDLSAANGNYVLTVTDDNGCSTSSSSYTIGLTGGPTIGGTAVITNVTCTSSGSITGLTVSGGTQPYNYSWNMSLSPTIDLLNATAAQYTLSIADDAGCVVQSGPYTIGQEAAPTLGGTASITDASCTQGGSITGITVSGGATPYTYEWNGNPASQTDLINVSAGSYTLVITDDNGCTLTSGPHVIGSQGTPSITGTATITNATCATTGSISGLSVSGGTAPYTYEWNGVSNPTIDINNLQAGTYTLVVEDANGCIATSTPYTITSPTSPSINGVPAVDNANCVQGGSISGLTVSNGMAPYSYSWNGGQYTSLDISNLTAGVYTLTVTDANGCSVTGNPITVGNDVLVDAQFNYNPMTVFVNDMVSFQDLSTGNITSWTWTIDTTTSTAQNPNYTFTQDGFYNVTLIVTDANGCVDSVSVTIEVLSDLEVPNIITANNDGVNDWFELKGLVPNTKLIILNRWGNLIYENDDYDNTWNGKDMRGNLVTEGVYTYKVILPDGNLKHGYVHVVYSN
jgi:gliding motility-associated-like protein